VTAHEHAGEAPLGYSHDDESEQSRFRDPPLALSGSVLIQGGDAKGHDTEDGDPGQEHDGGG